MVNFTRIGDGVWQWPGHDRDDDWRDHAGDPWAWNDGRNGNDDWSMNGGVWVWHGAFASSGSGSVAITGNGVRVWPGVWLWPSDRHWTGEWPWRARVRFNDWFQRGHGLWFWPGRIGIANLAAARSGSGSLAVVANVVQIGHGVWRLSPGQAGRGLGDWRWPRSSGSGIWVLSAAVARSSSGTLAISSHAVRIDTGVWLLPSDSDHGHTWLRQDGRDRADATSIESPSDNASAAVASPPGKLEPTGGAELPALASGEEAAVAALPADAMVPPGGDANLPTVDAAQPADNGGAVTAEPEANAVLAAAPMSTDVETAAVAPASVAEAVAPAPVASAPDASYVAPDAGYADLVPVEPALIPDAVAPAMMPSADAVYVEPAPVYVEPAFEAASEGNVGAVDPVFVEPVVDPGYAEPAVSPGFGDPGIDNPANFAPAPTFDPGIPAPDASAPSFVADPGGNTGGFAPAPVTAAPSGGGPGFDGAGATAPDIGFGDPGSSGPEAFVPDDMSPAAGVDLTDGDGEDG